MFDLKQICDRVRYLGTQPETPEARAEVEAAFAMKWEGVQSVAAHVLGRWGGRRSVELIKGWLLNSYRKDHHSSIEVVAVEALIECFELEDVPWIIDIYFEEPRTNWFDNLVKKLPLEAVRDRVIDETSHPDPIHRRKALLAMLFLHFPNAGEYVENFKSDPDEWIRSFACSLNI